MNKFCNEVTKEQCNNFYDSDDSDDFSDDEQSELIDGSCPYDSSDDDSDYKDNEIRSFDFSESSHINNSSDDDSDRSDDGDKKLPPKLSRVLSWKHSTIPKQLSRINNSSNDDSDTSDNRDKKLPPKLFCVLSLNRSLISKQLSHVNNSSDDDSDTSDDGDKKLPPKLSQGLSAKRSTIPKQLREITVPISPSSSQNSSRTNHCSRNCASSSNVQRVLPNRQYFQLDGNDQIGFDQMRAGSCILYNHSDVPMFSVDPKYYQNQVVSKFGNFDSVIFDEPTIIRSENVDHFMKKLCPDTKKLFQPDQIVLVFELRNMDQPSLFKQSKGQSILDYNWWTNQNIRSIVVLQQPLQRRNVSVYAVTDPFKYHYESYIVDVLNALRGTDLTMIFHPIGINSRSAHSIVVNK